MPNWSSTEVELIIADYFDMLARELRADFSYNKSEHRKRLKLLLNDRSDGSIEFKHQNISAVLLKYAMPYISGYKPRWNYQDLLETKVLNYLKGNSQWDSLFDSFARQDIRKEQIAVDFLKWKEPAPAPQIISKLNEPIPEYAAKAFKKNYLELEQNNTSIGNAGEKLVMDFEKWRLNKANLPHLADKIEWVSQANDGAGFDILSKQLDGKDMYIEVKTTTLGKETPFFFSKRENDFSEKKKSDFHLYRVFELSKNPKMFNLSGRFQDLCNMEAVNFKGYF